MELKLDLSNPRYTLLHRAGLAGLYMTVNQLKNEKINPPSHLHLQWDLTDRRVILEWQGQDIQFLNWLSLHTVQKR